MFERAIDTAVSRSSRVLRLLGIVVACCGAQSAGGPPTLPRSRATANASSKPRNRTIPDAGATTADSSTSPAADERASSATGASHAERDLCAPITAQIEAKLREAETALRRGATAHEILTEVAGNPFELLADQEVAYRCGCSKQRARVAVSSLGVDGIADVLQNEKQAVITCEFCRERYVIDEAELREIQAKLSEQQADG